MLSPFLSPLFARVFLPNRRSLMKDPRNKVICLDNCFSGDESNIDHWKGHPRFTYICQDVCVPMWVVFLPACEMVQAVFDSSFLLKGPAA